jgi:integrase/recombinase XerD
MKMTSTGKRATPQNYVQQLRLRSPAASEGYLWVLNGFQRFVAEQAGDQFISQEMVRQWLNDRIRVWPFHKLTDRARLVDRFLDWMVSQGALANNPLADLRMKFGQRTLRRRWKPCGRLHASAVFLVR